LRITCFSIATKIILFRKREDARKIYFEEVCKTKKYSIQLKINDFGNKTLGTFL